MPGKQYIKRPDRKKLIHSPVIELDNQTFFNFKDFDMSQGQTFEDWESENILARLLVLFKGYSNECLHKCQSKKFTIYGDFPPSGNTEFAHPKHVVKEAKWARFHIGGKICVAGHIVNNIFYIVFLDKEHKFWLSKK